VQEAVLARTREKLEALEKKVAAMEGQGEHCDSEEPGAGRN
jgi:BMFP domain-containing protein YqiC